MADDPDTSDSVLGRTPLGTDPLGTPTTKEEGPGGGDIDPINHDISAALAETIAPPGPDSPQERFEEWLKPPFNGKEWNANLDALGDEFGEFYDAAEGVLASQSIKTAQEGELDELGRFAGLPRKTNELDSEYRVRLIARMRTLVSSGTVPDILEVASVLLGIEKERITITTDFDTEAARYDISLSQTPIDEAGVTPSEFDSAITDVSAAGVRVTITTKGSFTHRSYDDYQNGVNDPSKGYSGVNYTGPAGEYAGRI